MKIISKLLLALLLIAPGLQASEVAPKTDEAVAAEMVGALEKTSQKARTRACINALKSGDMPVAKGLINLANIKEINSLIPHPLFYIKDHELISFLIPRSDPNTHNPEATSMFDQVLLMHYCVRASQEENPIHLDHVKLLLSQPGIRVNEVHKNSITALHSIAFSSMKNKNTHYLVQKLLDCNADPYIRKYNSCDEKGNPQGVGQNVIEMVQKERAWKDHCIKDGGKSPQLILDYHHYNTIIALCVESHGKHVEKELQKYMFNGPASIALEYIWEDYEKEAVEVEKAKTALTAPAKISE